MVEIPRCARDVTRSWLTDALSDTSFGRRITQVRSESLGAGAGFFGEITRLQLSYGGACGYSGPASLILKLPSQSNDARAIAFRLYEREVQFYRDVAPSVAHRVPGCYWSGFDVKTGRGALLLEDLGHWKAADQLKGIDARCARSAIDHLARVHARWWESTRLAELEWLPSFDGAVTRHLVDLYRNAWPDFAEQARTFLPANALRLGSRVGDELEHLLNAMAAPPVTICHGDFRADNLFFEQGHVAAIDWQLVCRGRGAFDVAHLLAQSMTVDERRRNGKAIVRRWHDALVRSGVTGYSFDDAVADYARSTLICIAYAVVGASLDRGNERGNAVAKAQVVRTFTAALDLEAESLLPV